MKINNHNIQSKYKTIQKAYLNAKGFTLVEMVVVLVIAMIISGILLFNYDSYRSNTTVNTVAQEIALTARKAQSYALGLQAVGILSNLPIKGYGVRFELTKPDQVTFFPEILSGSPTVVDNQFTSSILTCGAPAPGEECLEYYKIETGDRIETILVDNRDLKLDDPTASVDIVFKKPSGDAVFCVHILGSNCTSSTPTVVGDLEIVLVSEAGLRKRIHIYGNGQISVE
jgi:type II secretory pathway pseudopilin PulG